MKAYAYVVHLTLSDIDTMYHNTRMILQRLQVHWLNRRARYWYAQQSYSRRLRLTTRFLSPVSAWTRDRLRPPCFLRLGNWPLSTRI